MKGPSPWEARQLNGAVLSLWLRFFHESGTWGQQAKKELDLLLHIFLSLLVLSVAMARLSDP